MTDPFTVKNSYPNWRCSGDDWLSDTPTPPSVNATYLGLNEKKHTFAATVDNYILYSLLLHAKK